MIDFKHLCIYVATNPIDFRASIDGLCMRVKNEFKGDPQKGLYVFYNRHRDKLKILFWHHSGFILLYKRLERGHFHVMRDSTKKIFTIDEKQLRWLLAGMDWQLLSSDPELDFAHYG